MIWGNQTHRGVELRNSHNGFWRARDVPLSQGGQSFDWFKVISVENKWTFRTEIWMAFAPGEAERLSSARPPLLAPIGPLNR